MAESISQTHTDKMSPWERIKFMTPLLLLKLQRIPRALRERFQPILNGDKNRLGKAEKLYIQGNTIEAQKILSQIRNSELLMRNGNLPFIEHEFPASLLKNMSYLSSPVIALAHLKSRSFTVNRRVILQSLKNRVTKQGKESGEKYWMEITLWVIKYPKNILIICKHF